MEDIERMLTDLYTFPGQTHKFRFYKDLKNDVIHEILVFETQDALEELRYRTAEIEDELKYESYNRPIVKKRKMVKITSHKEIPSDNRIVYTSVSLDLLDINVILSIGEDILLAKTFEIKSLKRRKRESPTSGSIKEIGSFDPRNYRMLENTDKKRKLLISLYNYYVQNDSYYYESYYRAGAKESLTKTTFDVDDGVIDYGNEEFEKYSKEPFKIDIDDINDGIKDCHISKVKKPVENKRRRKAVIADD